jgi:ATP-dependent Clp protease ATP-binding subunit ClpX
MVSLDPLDKEALTSILSTPKNALLKQYQKLVGMDGVELEFTKEAIEKVADLAIERNTGARGLRSIMEAVMLDIMYEIPAMEGLTKVIITKELVEGTGKAEYVFAPAA